MHFNPTNKQYKEINGDCKVYSKSELGKWVCSQRSCKISASKNLSPKRIELLDNLGFLWSGVPEGHSRPIPGGDPRLNRAVAAKLVYPDLTISECLHLGGFQEAELNVVKDKKHTWRTVYVNYKEAIYRKVDTYENARRTGSRLKIEELVNTLRGEEANRYELVFGENASLLEGYFEAAAERRRNGIVEKPRKPRDHDQKRKRAREEDGVLEGDRQSQQQPGRKRACFEVGNGSVQPFGGDFQAQAAREQDNIARAQQQQQ